MPRRTPVERAETVVKSLLKQIEKKRAELADLEGRAAALMGQLGGVMPAEVKPKPAKQEWPPEFAAMARQQEEEPITNEPPPGVELAPGDNEGAGRWL